MACHNYKYNPFYHEKKNEIQKIHNNIAKTENQKGGGELALPPVARTDKKALSKH
jgi:hypothetical protein